MSEKNHFCSSQPLECGVRHLCKLKLKFIDFSPFYESIKRWRRSVLSTKSSTLMLLEDHMNTVFLMLFARASK